MLMDGIEWMTSHLLQSDKIQTNSLRSKVLSKVIETNLNMFTLEDVMIIQKQMVKVAVLHSNLVEMFV